MIAIADSGSTKTSWVFIDKDNKRYNYQTIGFNPYYQTSDGIYAKLQEELMPKLNFDEAVSNIFFYGAGCEQSSKSEEVASAIRKSFPKTSVFVTHDLLAAAKALFGNKEGIACISGTGSNTGLYNGKDITENVSSLGLYMGDEGSGGYKGKLLIKDYLRKKMPAHIRKAFEEKYTDRAPDILDAIYKKPYPSRYLASYTTFISEHIQDSYMQDLVSKSFNDMFDNCILKYKDAKTLPIGFIGSIAFYFQDTLKEVAAKKGANVGNIIRNPLEALTQYHLENGIL
jgi:glucosamine kinase